MKYTCSWCLKVKDTNNESDEKIGRVVVKDLNGNVTDTICVTCARANVPSIKDEYLDKIYEPED